jgi:hypothetical protein
MKAETHKEPPHDPHGIERFIDESRRHYFAELGKAGERIVGHGLRLTPANEAAVRWALTFASKDLDGFSDGQWSDCRYEVEYFAQLGPFEQGKRHKTTRTAANWPHSPDPAECVARPGIRQIEIERLPSKAVVRQLQQGISKDFDAIIRGENIERPLPPGSKERLVMIRESVNGETAKRAFRYLEVTNLVSVFDHHLFLALEDYADALRRCPGCAKRFLADRSNKDYCDPVCRNRAYMRAKRNVPPERYGKRGRPRQKPPARGPGSAPVIKSQSIRLKKKQKAIYKRRKYHGAKR